MTFLSDYVFREFMPFIIEEIENPGRYVKDNTDQYYIGPSQRQ